MIVPCACKFSVTPVNPCAVETISVMVVSENSKKQATPVLCVSTVDEGLRE